MDELDKEEFIEYGVDSLYALEETEIQDINVRRAYIGELSKYLVYNGFRNGPIEDIHAGKSMDIPEDVSRISNKEMEIIMKTATNQVAKLLEKVFLHPEIISHLKTMPFISPPSYWEDPNWKEIDEENKKLSKIYEKIMRRHEDIDKTDS